MLTALGQTINTMTLGGLALAVGMLVDDATVEVENIHRNHTPGKHLVTAILEGAAQIATPTLVGTLSICVVFFPVVLLAGVARFLFPPLALAVVAAMLTSYLLSRMLVPAMAHYLLPEFTALENVAMPLLVRRQPWPEIQGDAIHWLREVGLEPRGHHRSGGGRGHERCGAALA